MANYKNGAIREGNSTASSPLGNVKDGKMLFLTEN